MYNKSIEGSWTEYANNSVIKNVWAGHYSVPHVSSPDANRNEETSRLLLDFHGSNSEIRGAATDDGVTFDYGGIANPASGYAYGTVYMGNEKDDIRRIRLAESKDGKKWVVASKVVVVPGAEEGANISGGSLWEWNGQLYVIYYASSGKSYARTIDKTLRNVGTVPILLHKASRVGDDAGRVASSKIVSANGNTYLFHDSGDRLGAAIAWAKAA